MTDLHCESCFRTIGVERHGVSVCAWCLREKQEVQLMMTDRDRHNAWVQSLQDDVEFDPLIEFLEQLKEPQP